MPPANNREKSLSSPHLYSPSVIEYNLNTETQRRRDRRTLATLSFAQDTREEKHFSNRAMQSDSFLILFEKCFSSLVCAPCARGEYSSLRLCASAFNLIYKTYTMKRIVTITKELVSSPHLCASAFHFFRRLSL